MIFTTVSPQHVDRLASDLAMWEQELADARVALASEVRNKAVNDRFADATSKYSNAYHQQHELVHRITALAMNFGVWSNDSDSFLLIGVGYVLQLKNDRIRIVLCPGAEN